MDNFKMAYVLLCHKNAEQVNLLIQELNDENIDFFVHVDKKSLIQPQINKRRNLYFVEDRVEVHWGHYSQIECILNAFSLAKQTGNYDYIHVISGQDLPLVKNEVINRFFRENSGKEFVEFFEMPVKNARWGLYERVRVFYPKFLVARSRKISALRRRYTKLVMSAPMLKRSLKDLPPQLYKGANWMSITGDCMEYILEYVELNPQYKEFFQNTFCGDEIFFQTIILNSSFNGKVVNDIKRYVDWETGPDFPRTLTVNDLERIREKGAGCFWARKFDVETDAVVIKSIIQQRQ